MRKRLKLQILSIFSESVNIEKDDLFLLLIDRKPKLKILTSKGEYNEEFGYVLPFDYGEFLEYKKNDVNWKFIITPNSFSYDDKLKPVGIINNTIILANKGNISDDEKTLIRKVFNKDDVDFSLKENWEDSIFKTYKLTKVKDKYYGGIGVGKVARKSFYN